MGVGFNKLRRQLADARGEDGADAARHRRVHAFTTVVTDSDPDYEISSTSDSHDLTSNESSHVKIALHAQWSLRKRRRSPRTWACVRR